VLNIAGPELLSVRRIAEDFAARFQKRVEFDGVEAPDALLSNAQKSMQLFWHAAHLLRTDDRLDCRLD